jgi:hypothetical protein
MEKENFLTFIKDEPSVSGKRHALYRCVCGVECVRQVTRVKHGITWHCGCKHDIVGVVGEKFGMLTLDELRGHGTQGPGRGQMALYRCDCGKYKELPISRVRRGEYKSCGCTLRVQIEPGERFGQLVALCPAPSISAENGGGNTTWIFQCDCGECIHLPVLRVKRKDGKGGRTACDSDNHARTSNGKLLKENRSLPYFEGRAYRFIAPTGKEIVENTLSSVIRHNAELFSDEDLPNPSRPTGSMAYDALRNLVRVTEYGLTESTWKGWTVPESERERLIEAYKKKNQISEFRMSTKNADPDHFAGKYWEFIGPHGLRMEGFNLHELVREHAAYFSPEDLEWDNNDYCAATAGLRTLFSLHADGRRKLQSWKGWTIGAKMEKELALRQAHCLERLREQRLAHQE